MRHPVEAQAPAGAPLPPGDTQVPQGLSLLSWHACMVGSASSCGSGKAHLCHEERQCLDFEVLSMQGWA